MATILTNHLWVRIIMVMTAIFIIKDLQADVVDIRVRASAGQKYDDNITFTAQNRIADFISVLSTGASISLQGKKTHLELSADITQQLYWKYRDNHNTSEAASFKLSQELSKYDAILISDVFSHAYEPRSFEEEFARVGGRVAYYNNRFDVTYVRDFSEQFSVRLGYGNDLDLSTGSDLIDSYVHRPSLEGRFALSTKTIFSARYDYLYRHLDPGGTAKINTLSGGLRQFLTDQLSIEGVAGADFIDSYNGNTFVKPLWIMTLTDQLTPRESASLSFTQRYSTNPYTDDVFNSWRISGEINSQLRKKLSGSASAFYGQGEYVSLGFKENLIGLSAELFYELRENVKASISYTHSQNTSDMDTREYQKNVIFLGVSTEF